MRKQDLPRRPRSAAWRILTQLACVYLYDLFIWERQTQLDLPAGSLHRQVQLLGLSQAEAGAKGFSQVFHVGAGAQHPSHSLLPFPGTWAQSWSKSGAARTHIGAHIECLSQEVVLPVLPQSWSCTAYVWCVFSWSFFFLQLWESTNNLWNNPFGSEVDPHTALSTAAWEKLGFSEFTSRKKYLFRCFRLFFIQK